MNNLPTRGIGLTGLSAVFPTSGLGIGLSTAGALPEIEDFFIAIRIGV